MFGELVEDRPEQPVRVSGAVSRVDLESDALIRTCDVGEDEEKNDDVANHTHRYRTFVSRVACPKTKTARRCGPDLPSGWIYITVMVEYVAALPWLWQPS